jgi:hypothetical protein
MVTLSVYFEYIKILCTRYLLNILWPYYQCIQAILFYFLKLLQMKFIKKFIKYFYFYFYKSYKNWHNNKSMNKKP